MERSNINGRAKGEKGGLVTSTGRHTPDNGSYTNLSADPLEKLLPRFQRKWTHHKMT